MFFQTIHQMLAQGTDLSINIRRVNNNLTVAVMPKRTGLKEETGQLIVPLVLSGTPGDLDAEFLQQITSPLQKVQGILTNIETFEKQAEAAAAKSKTAKSANDKETKEAREKREKMEKLLKRAEEAFAAGRYSEATTAFRQAKVLADATKQKEIEARMQEVQKKASEGSLFAETAPQSQPVQQQPTARQHPSAPQHPANNMPNGQSADGQMQMFTAQPPMQQSAPQPAPQPTYQPASQPLPQPRIMQPQPTPQAYQPEMPQPQPMYGGYYQNPANNVPVQPVEQQPVGQPQMQQTIGQPQMYVPQNDGQPWQTQQWQQPQAMPQQPQMSGTQTAPANTAREYHSQPQPTETFCFDKDDESDRELLREDPYAEYPDFPKEYRMKDAAQMELVCC